MWIVIRTVAYLGLSLLSLSVSAQSAADGDERVIALREALERTLAANPDLTAFGFQIAAAEGRLEQAGLAPNPELGVALQDVVGTGAFRGVRSAETTVTLGWVLERGVRARIVDSARAGVGLRMVDAGIVRIDAAAETARRFLESLGQQGRLENAGRAVALAQATVTLIAESVSAGRSLEAELARAEAELARAESIQDNYEYEVLSAHHRLSAQWGATQPDFSTVSGSVDPLPVLEPFAALLARMDANPELLRFMSQQRLDEAELQLARARAKPGWQVSAGLRRFDVVDDFALVGGLTVPLPVRNRNQGNIAAARADIARTEAEMTAAHVRIETMLFGLYQELNQNVQLAARLRADVIPRLERALADTRRAYELGRYGYSEWRIVQDELLAANNDLLEAGIAAHGLVIEIERLTGTPVAASSAAQ